MTNFVKVARTSDIEPGQAKIVDVKGKEIALFNIGEVTCPLHGAKFDVRSGEVLGPPAYDDVASYAVRVSGGDLEVDVG